MKERTHYRIKDFLQLPEINGVFSEDSIRYFKKGNMYGFDKCYEQLGKGGTILIHRENFQRWLNGEYKE